MIFIYHMILLTVYVVGEKPMTQNCEICGDELEEQEYEDGICKRCKRGEESSERYIPDKDYIDPGIT
jgi:hypothetical protein